MKTLILLFFFSTQLYGATLYISDSLINRHPLISTYLEEIIKPLYHGLKPELKLEVLNMPSLRLAKLENKGETDFITARVHSKTYEKFYHKFSYPISKNILVKLIYDDSIKKENKLIGLTRGNRINKKNRKILSSLNYKFIELADHKTLIKMYNKARIDGFIILSSEWNELKQLKTLKRNHSRKDLFKFNSYHYIHKKHAQYIPQIEKRIKKLDAEKKWDFVDFVKLKRSMKP